MIAFANDPPDNGRRLPPTQYWSAADELRCEPAGLTGQRYRPARIEVSQLARKIFLMADHAPVHVHLTADLLAIHDLFMARHNSRRR